MTAYNKLMEQKRSAAVSETKRKDELPSDLKEEFLLWMESRQKDFNESPVNASQVNHVDDATDSFNVVKSETETMTTTTPDVNDNIEMQDFDEFKDVIDDKDEKEFLKVPLMIVEDDEVKDEKSQKASIAAAAESEEPSRAESSNDEINFDQYTIDVKLTLSNAPLEVTTSLSTSSFSLASDKSSDDGTGRKRPATHSKGRAPPPPTIDVISGQFYDSVTKKYFKETEL